MAGKFCFKSSQVGTLEVRSLEGIFFWGANLEINMVQELEVSVEKLGVTACKAQKERALQGLGKGRR